MTRTKRRLSVIPFVRSTGEIPQSNIPAIDRILRNRSQQFLLVRHQRFCDHNASLLESTLKRHFAIAVALGTSLAAGIASTTAVAAQDPQTCAQIEDSLRRLDCFDRMFPEDATEKPAGDEPAAKSPWQIREERSPIDDSPTVVALLPPTDVSFTGIGDGEVFLIIRCAENTTAIFLSTNMFMTPDQVSVTTRIDSETAETSRWNRSSNYKAVGLWNGASAIPFVKRLADGTKLAVRIEADDVITAEFGLGDVSPQVDKIRAACNW